MRFIALVGSLFFVCISVPNVEAFAASLYPGRLACQESWALTRPKVDVSKRPSVTKPEQPPLTITRMSSYGGGEYDGGSYNGNSYGSDGYQGERQMEVQELHVEFTDDGRILLEVKGVKGEVCRELTEDLVKALGDVIQTENTSEFYEERVVNRQHDGIKQGWSYDSSKPEW